MAEYHRTHRNDAFRRTELGLLHNVPETLITGVVAGERLIFHDYGYVTDGLIALFGILAINLGRNVHRAIRFGNPNTPEEKLPGLKEPFGYYNNEITYRILSTLGSIDRDLQRRNRNHN